MKNMELVCVVLCAELVAICGASCRRESDGPIHSTFQAYKQALSAGDGNAAAMEVDSESIAYYSKMKELALSGTAAQVKQAQVMDRMMVVLLRLRIPKNELIAMSGEQLFVYGVKQGWISKESVSSVEMGRITFDGEVAFAEVVHKGRASPLKFKFRKERGRWLLNTIALIDIGNMALSQIAKQQGIEEDELILNIAEQLTEKPVPATVWDPLE